MTIDSLDALEEDEAINLFELAELSSLQLSQFNLNGFNTENKKKLVQILRSKVSGLRLELKDFSIICPQEGHYVSSLFQFD